MGQVFYLLDSNKAQLFLAIQEDEIVAVVITEVVEFVSGARCLKVILCGGKGAMSGGMGGMIDKMEEFAMLALCSTIQVEGRKGWERALPDDYRYSYTVFEKEMF